MYNRSPFLYICPVTNKQKHDIRHHLRTQRMASQQVHRTPTARNVGRDRNQVKPKPIKVMNFPKHKQNLRVVYNDLGKFVQSYNTLVARVDGNKLVQLGWWSETTQKHINYAAQQLGLELVKA